jgi:hypothetical protein
MVKNKITLTEALTLLRKNKLNEHYEINYAATDQVEATDAIQLGALGFDVPEQKIVYHDSSMEEDEAFAGEWIAIDSDMEDYKQHLTIQLQVDDEVKDWLASSDINVDLLMSELLTGFYRSAKVLEGS